MGNPFKKQTFRQACIGKRVKIVSHVSPVHKNKVGVIVDVKNGNVAEVKVVTVKQYHDEVLTGTETIHVNVKGLMLAEAV